MLSGVNFTGKTDPRFILACVLTGCALFTLGALKVNKRLIFGVFEMMQARFSNVTWYRSGLFMLIVGAIAAGISYLVSFMFACFYPKLRSNSSFSIDKIVPQSSNCNKTTTTMTTMRPTMSSTLNTTAI